MNQLIESRYTALKLMVEAMNDKTVSVAEQAPNECLRPYMVLNVESLQDYRQPALMVNYGQDFNGRDMATCYVLQLKTEGGDFSLSVEDFCQDVDGVLTLSSLEIFGLSIVLKGWISIARINGVHLDYMRLRSKPNDSAG